MQPFPEVRINDVNGFDRFDPLFSIGKRKAFISTLKYLLYTLAVVLGRPLSVGTNMSGWRLTCDSSLIYSTYSGERRII